MAAESIPQCARRPMRCLRTRRPPLASVAAGDGAAALVRLAPFCLVVLWVGVAGCTSPGNTSLGDASLPGNASDLERVRHGVDTLLASYNVTPGYEGCLRNATAVFRRYRRCFFGAYCDSPNASNYPTTPENDASQMFGFLARFLGRYVVHVSDNVSVVYCSELEYATVFCRIAYRRPLQCQPMAAGKFPDGLCLTLYQFEALVAPLVLGDDPVAVAPGIRVLAAHYCAPRSFAGCACRQGNGSVPPYRAACPAPYVKTSDATRFNGFYARDVFAAFVTVTTSPYGERLNVADNAFPGSARLQCADRCLSDYDASDALVAFLSHLVRATFAVQTLLPVLLLVAAVRSGFKAAWEYPNRLMLYLAGNIFVYGLHLLPHFLVPITGQSLSCYDDGTKRPPAFLGASSLCLYSYGAHTFAIAVYRWVFLFVAFCWWHLVLQLQRESRWACITDVKLNGPVEIAAFLLALVWGGAMVGISAQGPFDVPHVVEFCLSRTGHSDWIIIGPDLVCILLSFVFMIDGCRRLLALRRKSAELHRELGISQSAISIHAVAAAAVAPAAEDTAAAAAATNGSESPGSDAASPSSPRCLAIAVVTGPCSRLAARLRSALPRTERPAKPPTRRADRAMLLLLQRLFLIMLGLLVTGSTSEILYIVLNSSNGVNEIRFLDEAAAETPVRYEQCRLATCGAEPLCDRLLARASRRWLTFQITFYTLNMVNALLMCAGVFSPLTWRRRISSDEKRKRHWRSVALRSFAQRFAVNGAHRPNSLPVGSVSSTSELTRHRQSTGSDPRRSAGSLQLAQAPTPDPERDAAFLPQEPTLSDVPEQDGGGGAAVAASSSPQLSATRGDRGGGDGGGGDGGGDGGGGSGVGDDSRFVVMKKETCV